MKKLSFSILAALAGFAGFSHQASAQTVFGLSVGGLSLRTFDLSTPGTLSSPITISGLGGGESVLAIDFRPSNQALYGYTSANRLLIIQSDGSTSVASVFGTIAATPTPGTTIGIGSDVPSPFPPASSNVSIDVNPNVPAGGAVGALRIVDIAGGNLRLAFSNDTLNRDDTLTISGGGGVPQIVGVAYTNNDVNGATGTGLYYIDAASNSVFTTSSPNDGELTAGSAVPLGIDIPTSDVGFDVPLFGSNLAYLSANDMFYSLTIGAPSGPLTLIGQIGGPGVEVTDIAIVPEPTTSLLLLGGLGSFLFRRQRNG